MIGEVTTDFEQSELHLAADQAPRDYAFRVTEVLRGSARVGDALDVQYLLANWPWFKVDEHTFPACTYLPTVPGDVLALAFDAYQPRQTVTWSGRTWVQPATRYNAVGVIEAMPFDPNSWRSERQVVTLQQIRSLAALPQTDTAGIAPRTGAPDLVLLVALALGLALGLTRFRGATR